MGIIDKLSRFVQTQMLQTNAWARRIDRLIDEGEDPERAWEQVYEEIKRGNKPTWTTRDQKRVEQSKHMRGLGNVK